MAALDDLRLTEQTIVIFTTDHGLALPRATCTLYGSGLDVALITRAPSQRGTAGRRIDVLVSNVDVVPTLLDSAGVAVPDNVRPRVPPA